MFYINYNGSLMTESFIDSKNAHAFIAAKNDEEAYLMEVIKLSEEEASLIKFIDASYNNDQAKALYNILKNDEEMKSSLIRDFERLGVSNIITKAYLDYFYDFATGLNYIGKMLVGLDAFLDDLVATIDFTRDHDSAVLKYKG